NGRIEAAREHAADVGRVDRLAQLSRLATRRAVEEEIQGEPRAQVRRAGPGIRPLWAREDQRADPRVSGGTPSGEKSEGLDPVFCRISGREQNITGAVDREGNAPQVSPDVFGRRAV